MLFRGTIFPPSHKIFQFPSTPHDLLGTTTQILYSTLPYPNTNKHNKWDAEERFF
jgi:hypothetical protein